ncbi:MAG TPA: hypothetical protein VFV08_11185, partial [Puia sp.]|nr:hypothetical protein [Puia sp.]
MAGPGTKLTFLLHNSWFNKDEFYMRMDIRELDNGFVLETSYGWSGTPVKLIFKTFDEVLQHLNIVYPIRSDKEKVEKELSKQV